MRHVFLGGAVAACLIGHATLARSDGIQITGTAEMGLAGGFGLGTEGAARTTLLSDLDLQIRMSRTTDSGLTLALEFDLDALDTRSRVARPLIPTLPPRN